mmetsp:Transcript_7547/g.13952  ORF Transcript_7547/g.13952 Transcript_7547/m.13952 type:complete len:102 (+) Transcript_7547:190-495(+)
MVGLSGYQAAMECRSFQEARPSSALRGGHSTFSCCLASFLLSASTSAMDLGSASLMSSQAGRSQSSWKSPEPLLFEGIVAKAFQIEGERTTIACWICEEGK